MCASDSVCKIAVAKNRKFATARGISNERASEIGLPVSIDSARANFSRSRSINSAIRSRKFDRSPAVFFDQSQNAFLCRSNGNINIVRVAVCNLRIRLTCRGLDIVEVSATDRLDELAVDKILDLEWLGAHGEAKCKPSSSTSNVQRGKIVLARDMMLI